MQRADQAFVLQVQRAQLVNQQTHFFKGLLGRFAHASQVMFYRGQVAGFE